MDLTAKTALIGGSTQGIGFAAAQSLASLGAACILISRNEEKLKKAISGLEAKHGQKHQYIVADFDQPQIVHDAAAAFIGRQPIDILVNNTGGPPGGPVIDATPEAFLKAFQQHLICSHILTQLVTPWMKDNNYGRIVNVISTSVKIPLKDLGVSNTVRGAVASWAKTMANELGRYGITVNNVLPGATATGRLDTIINNKVNKTGEDKEAVKEEMLHEVPARRFGLPEEIAAVIAFLCTPAAAYVNGASIPVDGGRTGSI